MTTFRRTTRQGWMETVSQSDRYTAADRSRAIDVLRGVVLIVQHPYAADPHSGAGNCWCGRGDTDPLHQVEVLP